MPIRKPALFEKPEKPRGSLPDIAYAEFGRQRGYVHKHPRAAPAPPRKIGRHRLIAAPLAVFIIVYESLVEDGVAARGGIVAGKVPVAGT